MWLLGFTSPPKRFSEVLLAGVAGAGDSPGYCAKYGFLESITTSTTEPENTDFCGVGHATLGF